jgi:two-component system OmpR family sensor kinase
MRPRRPNLHIRTRIALWIAAISSALLVVMAVTVFGVFQQQLVASLDDTLSLRAASNRDLVDLSTSPPSLRIVRDPARELFSGEAVLRLYRSDGTLLDDASPATGRTDEERELVLAAAKLGADVYRTVDLADDEDYRVVASLVGDPGPGQVVLVTGLERSRVNSPLRILRIILAIAVPVTAGGAGLGGYWVAQRALHPVSAMAATAQVITHGDLDQRVPGADSGDELGHLAATLNSMIARLGGAVERERRFTADAAHELRTPLAAIETGIDVTLAHERSPAEYRRVLALIRGQTRRLDHLANQLLLLSRLDADEVRGTFAPVELNGLLEAVVESFRDGHPHATVTADIPTESFIVAGDVELLARAVMNLLDNAATHAGETVTAALRVHRDGHVVVVSIADDGPGIPPALASDVFRRFRRGDAARSGRGTGLGLSIVEAIAICHGGTVRLASSGESAGARFEIALPLAAGGDRNLPDA